MTVELKVHAVIGFHPLERKRCILLEKKSLWVSGGKGLLQQRKCFAVPIYHFIFFNLGINKTPFSSLLCR
jgi:hypothetical protein